MTVEKLQKLFYYTYLNLKDEFNLDSTIQFQVQNWSQFINCMYSNSYYYDCTNAQDVIDEINDDSFLFNGSLAMSRYFINDTDPFYYIIISEENLYKIYINILQLGIDDKKVEQYVEQIVRHEIGHILHYIETFKSSKDKYDFHKKIVYETNRAYKAFFKYVETNDVDDEQRVYNFERSAISKYYSYKTEHLANVHGKVNTRKLIELEMLIRLGLKKGKV